MTDGPGETDRPRARLPAGGADDRGARASPADRAGAFAQGAARRRAGDGGGADRRGRRRCQGRAARGRCAGRQGPVGDRQRRDQRAGARRRHHAHPRPGRAGREEGRRQLSSPSSASCWRWRWPRAATSARRCSAPGVDAAEAQRRDRAAARRAHRRHAGRRGPLRRAEEICARPHRSRARGQARPGDRPRRGNPPHHPGARAADQEQSGADRRARRRQDRHRRRAWRCASPTATCPTGSRTGACCRSTWDR